MGLFGRRTVPIVPSPLSPPSQQGNWTDQPRRRRAELPDQHKPGRYQTADELILSTVKAREEALYLADYILFQPPLISSHDYRASLSQEIIKNRNGQ